MVIHILLDVDETFLTNHKWELFQSSTHVIPFGRTWMSASDRCKMAAVLVAHSSSCCRCGSPLRTPEITSYPCTITSYRCLSHPIPAYPCLSRPHTSVPGSIPHRLSTPSGHQRAHQSATKASIQMSESKAELTKMAAFGGLMIFKA